jgi:hypothetical protein
MWTSNRSFSGRGGDIPWTRVPTIRVQDHNAVRARTEITEKVEEYLTVNNSAKGLSVQMSALTPERSCPDWGSGYFLHFGHFLSGAKIQNFCPDPRFFDRLCYRTGY